ncbi:MAG: hypothetical protein ACF8R9_04090 [Phycisphaerales bacterium JB054]
MPHNRPTTRRGSAYVLVLALSIIVTVIGATAIQSSRVGIRSAMTQRDAADAALVAQGGLDHLLQLIATTPEWRTVYGSAPDLSAKLLSGGGFRGGSYTWELEDETDGDLFDDPADPVRVRCTAVVGQASRSLSVELAQSGSSPLDVLRMGFYTSKNVLSLTSTPSLVSPDAPLGAMGTFHNSVEIIGDVEAGLITGTGTISGNRDILATPKDMPPSSVFDLYKARATTISWTSHYGTFEPGLLSPGANPYGAANAEGIYFLSVPAWDQLKLDKSRIVGTLLIDVGMGAKIKFDDLIMEPAQPNMPTILIRTTSLSDEVSFRTGSSSLSESSIGVNLNPGHTPYRGSSDSQLNDSYATQINGLIHVLGSLGTVELQDGLTLNGCLLSESGIELVDGGAGRDWRITPSPSLTITPPEGYSTARGGGFAATEGSLRWDVAP